MNAMQKQLILEPKSGRYKLLIFILILTALLWSSSTLEFSASGMGGAVIARNIFLGIFNPDTAILFNWQNGVPFLLLETLAIAFVGTLVGSILAIPLAFLSSQNVVGRPISYVTSLFIMAIRTIPVFVYGLMFIRVTGPGPFAGLLTMALASVGMLSKLFAETIEELDTGIIESLDAAGCNGFEKIRYGVIPQLASDFLSTVIYRFDMNIRDVAVLGLVGAGGIGAPLIFAMNSHRWNEAGAIIIGLILLVFIIEWLSTRIRKKLARG
ncbi:MAG: phosphonate ABC transporter, permease protein PhnE [Turicibacter sp.]|nr:phosphonate ABC transporter, permease protein PhnE [Turicibacter sp.]